MKDPLKTFGNNENNQRFKDFFEHIAIGLVMCRIDGTFIDVNQPFCDLTGYTKEELLKMSFKDVSHPDDLSLNLEKLELALEGKIKNYSLEKRYIRKDKNIIWVNITISLIRGDNAPDLFLGTVENITKRKQVTDRIQRNEHILRLLVKHSPASIAMFDTEMKYIVASNRFLIDYDLGEQDVTGRSHYEIFPEISDRWKEIHKRCLEGNTEKSDEDQFPRANGKIDWVRWEILPWYESHDVIGGIILFSEVITKYKLSEEALQQERDRFYKLVATSPGAIYSFRLNPDGTHCMPYVSPHIYEITGFTPDELAQDTSPVDPLVHPEDRPMLVESITKSANTLETWKCAYRYYHPSKALVWLEVHSIPKHESDGSTIWYGYINDVTERKEAENLLLDKNKEYHALNEEYLVINEELLESLEKVRKINLELEEAKERAEESDRLKTIFLANMSHEVRTPLNAILGFSNLLEEANISQTKRKHFIDIIQNSGERLMRLINDIIDVARLETKQIFFDIKECGIYRIIKNSVETFGTSKLLLKKSEIKLFLKFPEDLKSVSCLIDEVRFQQVLDNLIANAIKYTEKGFVEVGASLTEEKGEEKIKIYVKDTGFGIPKEKDHLIFARFRQVEEDIYHEGTGLGLNISKGIVEHLGGDIGFTSEFGKGSTFYFTLPVSLNIPKQKKRPKNKKPDIDLNNKSIIIAEDDYYSFLYLKELFKDYKLNLVHAENGQILMNLLEKSIPDLILLDINMPVKTGFECLKEIREKGLDVKIIGQTAYAMSNDEEKCYKAGCSGYISKPVKKTELFKVISKVLSNN